MKTNIHRKLASAIVLLIFTFIQINTIWGQNDSSKIDGAWTGFIKTGSIELRVVFNISQNADNSLKSTLDSPDQGAKGIPLGKTVFDGKKLEIEAAALAASYVGEMENDSTINGTWTQGGGSFPLKVIKQVKTMVVNRPQNPKTPFPYVTEEVTVQNKQFGFELSGTLSLPNGDGPFPAVVLITGSGQQNRDEEIFEHKPFLVIANYLTSRGFAVLRCDDRGVGKSKGSLVDVTSYDFCSDVKAEVDFLKNDKRIDSKKIGLIGHSEGGLIAMIVASERSDIAFIISLAGPGVKGEDVLLEQSSRISKLMGSSDEEVKTENEISQRIFKILETENDNKKISQKISESLKAYFESINEKDADSKIEGINKKFSPKAYSWLRYFLLSEPSEYLKKVKCPVLALNGSKDVQVIAETNLSGIKNSLKDGGNKDFMAVKIDNVNHLFQHCTTGLMNEYGRIEETFSEDVLKMISDWLTNRFL